MENQPYRLHKDLPYLPNGHERQRLDLYLPLAGSSFPLIIWFHGGGFVRGAKEPSPKNQIPLDYLEKGFAIAAVGYRLSPDTRFPGAIHDAKAAVSWLRQQAEVYQLDSQRFVAWGHSAGGYLSTMVGLTAWCQHLLGVDYTPLDAQVSAVIDESGPINFLTMDDQKLDDGLPHNTPDSPESLFMGNPIQEIPELVKTANPIQYLNAAFVPRFLVVHGNQDKHVPYQQSVELVDALNQCGASVAWQLLDAVGHFDIDRTKNTSLIDSFLGKR
ncbi:alpha/beta hydrolase [Spirosoma sp. KCTC 42546]|uniref:alpha/beta hydrolase n=1 Tax=Spirosoma sp. KCTC 42546 TaxID=2520506 RepID=UPI00115BC678|nr:alpha/beta hydrolase [Spirosoma sp. KCTC 42546]QDK81986.1 alpha/beta hydrolase [Spirosoma sp. KCTC 42546]